MWDQCSARKMNVIGHDYYAVWADNMASVTIEDGYYKIDEDKELLDASNSFGHLVDVMVVNDRKLEYGGSSSESFKIKGGLYDPIFLPIW